MRNMTDTHQATDLLVDPQERRVARRNSLTKADSVRSTMRFLLQGATFLVALATAIGCGSGQPSPDAARDALASSLDDGNSTRLRLLSFEKTDGRTREHMGVRGYDLMFRAEVEFISNAMFSVGSPLVSEGKQITTSEYRPPAKGFSWADFRASSQGARAALKGDMLALAGTVSFELRESGWVPIDLSFGFAHKVAERLVGAWDGYSVDYQRVQIDENPSIEVRVARNGSKFKVTITQAYSDTESVFDATFRDGQLVVDGDPKDFYKYQVPVIKVDSSDDTI